MYDPEAENSLGKLPILDAAEYGDVQTPIMAYDADAEEPADAPIAVDRLLVENDIPAACSALRRRIDRLAFNNTTELNSTIYFCRINHNDFNYSSNPTYLEDSKVRVKESTEDAPVSYISTVGLYSADNELLAVAKLSEVLRKDPTNEMVLRVRLDY